MVINFLDLGTMEYEQCLNIQNLIREKRDKGEISDTLILVEHPPVLTFGTSGKDENLLVSPQFLEEMGVKTFKINRGGDVTYHGPGQIVGYPIINLKQANIGLKEYLYKIQDTFVSLLKDEYGICAHKEGEKYTGVWVGEDKITAIGIHVKHMITLHGFAFNVNTNLSHFNLINPCGLIDRGPTSLKKILGKDFDMDIVKKHVVKHFEKTFDVKTIKKELADIID